MNMTTGRGWAASNREAMTVIDFFAGPPAPLVSLRI
jgi:hypothetical protein